MGPLPFLRRLGVLPLALLLGGALWAGGPRPAGAQTGPATQLVVDPVEGTLELRIGDLLEEERFRNALEDGLPLRVRVVAELWRDGFFDAQEGRAEWRATVVHDPLDQTFRLSNSSGSPELILPTLDQVRLAIQQTFTLPLRPERNARYYYLATLDVETLSLSDLEELQRWLRGDLGPGIAGEGGGVDGAVTRGLGRVLQRALGLPALRIRLQSPPFPFP